MSRFQAAPPWFLSLLEGAERRGYREVSAVHYQGQLIAYYDNTREGFRVTLGLEYGTLKVLFFDYEATILAPFNPLPPNTVLIEHLGDDDLVSVDQFRQIFNSETR